MSAVLDVMTPQAMVVLQDRPVAALTPWLAEALGECASSGRTLQIVTPATARLSMPLRVAGAAVQWVVRDQGGYYEGLTGRPLQWDGRMFAPVPQARDYAPGFVTRPTGPIGTQLTLTYRARHLPQEPLGGQVERLITMLTGRPPVGWGEAEPAGRPWQRAELNTRVREHGGTLRLVVVGSGGGRTAQAIVEFSQGGAAEVTTLTVGHPPADPPQIAQLPALVESLVADQPVSSLLAQLSPGRVDVTYEPRWTGQPAPIGMAVAGERTGPSGIPARKAGTMTWFELGDGRSADGWKRHQELLRHLTG
ncbi:DUF6177 family protein [Thermomonospora catenispora]|uniref:DUF6177 family protein n=1 Tax=Thermomonospora catenispora TaxID=2493090 RepID=UPI00111FC085|nr:DUF6177 family protein [Thermomonospora catenispora]TNY34486.1 hypothetical protein EIO00_23555 [Thermomonospora catenispora]